jgi:hypothetical protein
MIDDARNRKLMELADGIIIDNQGYDGVCEICGGDIHQGEIADCHHGLHNTKGNNKNYPLFTPSLINRHLVHRKCHSNHPEFGAVTNADAWRLEAFLDTFEMLLRDGVIFDMPKLLAELQIMYDEYK